MNITIYPHQLTGKIQPPYSKSVLHRVLIASTLANSANYMSISNPCDDIKVTLNALKLLNGSKIPIINCQDSASTLRFLIPVFSALKKEAIFTGSERLLQRPIKELLDTINEKSLHIKGKLTANNFTIRGDISSQYISGLLFALPLLDQDSFITISTKSLQSKDYVKLTIQILQKFGISIKTTSKGYFVKGKQTYTCPKHLTIERDWSAGAFFHTANFLGSNVTIRGLNKNSVQPDKAITKIIQQFKQQTNLEIDVSPFPDITPCIALMAALRPGQTKIINATRLRLKESDRLSSICQTLEILGSDIKVKEDAIIINGKHKLNGGIVDAANDHRIVMMAAIASIKSCNKITITGAEAISKSYPAFFKDIQSLGAKTDGI